MNEQELKETIARENGEFKKILDEHRTCELEIERLRLKPHVTETDALLERDLKKRKLALKDRMYLMMLEHEKKR